MEKQNETQDIDLENNDSVVEEGEDTPEEVDNSQELQVKLEELEKENAILKRHNKKLQKVDKVEKPTPESKETTEDKPNDLDYGEKAYLRSALDLKGADELQLAKDWKGKYGQTVEEMETDEVFLNRLQNLREVKASQDALPKGTKRSNQSAVDPVEIAYRKFQESGELPKDFETRTKVIDKMATKEKGPNFNF